MGHLRPQAAKLLDRNNAYVNKMQFNWKFLKLIWLFGKKVQLHPKIPFYLIEFLATQLAATGSPRMGYVN
jgi:hypothetical protein